MSHEFDPSAMTIDQYLAQHERKELLRFLTCGSVDDGKSTLIGRLLFDTKMIYEDQLAAVKRDSLRHGTTQTDFDPALLTDGLKAEREQGITIDVAYRYFSTARRKFIIADTPGHEQYTRNMATGASNCDLAIILIDARKGIITQTRRHSFIAALLGIRHVVVAVNKMDLVGYSSDVFERIRNDYSGLAARLELRDVTFIPVAALHGDNVVAPSANMPWYHGATLMHHLETVHIASDRNLIDFRFPVQLVSRPNADFRGFSGTVASGVVRVGDEVMSLPSRRASRVRSIVTHGGELDEAFAPMAVTLTLADEIDISRGDMLVRLGNTPHVSDRFDAMIVWMSETPLEPGKRYLVKHTTRKAFGLVSAVRYRMDIDSLHRVPADGLNLNEIGRCEMTLNRPIAWDAYTKNRATGAFILIDRLTNATVAAGTIVDRAAADEPDFWIERRSAGRLNRRESEIDASQRESKLGHGAATILLTGLSGAGKSTLAYALEKRLFEMGVAASVIDGQNLRLGISRDLGYDAADRSENLRRGAEIARMMNDAGLVCICAFVAPSNEPRQRARDVIGGERFILVHLNTPVELCRQRDREGIYRASDAGDVGDLPGVAIEYEPPAAADLVIPTHEWPIQRCVESVVDLLRKRGVISA
ncbi:MAG: sulfate adenylyltransferase subunit CysN [Phycisphaerales bacterium]|nr:sulfate adenylyltransferase subunit CysN [Phycisphaerales bacterium]